LLVKMKKIKFITSDIVAVVDESDMDPDVFQVLQTVWVKAIGIPKLPELSLLLWSLLDWLEI